jgi:hypothetical protein
MRFLEFWRIRFLDKIFCWHGWTIVKWPFGVLLLWFVIFLIWKAETVPNYDRVVVEGAFNRIKPIHVDPALRDVFKIHTEKVKNLN